MPLLLVLLFIVVPLVELYVIIQVGQAIGVLPTIGLLLADSILGSMLLRAQGRAAWRRFTDAMNAGRMPHREVLDGALIIFGGALLLTPGFVTDILGLALLLPPSRALIRRSITAMLARRLRAGRRVVTWAYGPRHSPGAPDAGYDVEGTAREMPGSAPEPPAPETAEPRRIDRPPPGA